MPISLTKPPRNVSPPKRFGGTQLGNANAAITPSAFERLKQAFIAALTFCAPAVATDASMLNVPEQGGYYLYLCSGPHGTTFTELTLKSRPLEAQSQ